MQYDLELLEDLISVTLDPKRLLLIEPSAAEIAAYERIALSEKARIKKRMKAITSKPVKEKYKEKYIQRNQQDIIALKNLLLNYLLPYPGNSLVVEDGDRAIVRLYKFLFQCLKELLENIEAFFYGYFNLDEKVPESFLLRNRPDLIESVKKLKNQFTKSGYDTRLIKIIFSPITKLCEDNAVTVSYRYFLYIKQLITELEKLKRNQSSYLFFNTLTGALLRLNFNSGEFISFMIGEIVDIINALPEAKQKTEKLFEWRKEINQLIMKASISLKPNCSTVKEQINYWITEEIFYLESKQRLLSVAPVIKDELLNDEDKLHFSVSVNVLSLFARAAHDSALLLNKKGTLIFKNIAKYCRTIQASNLSAESMDKKSHVAERAHKEKAIMALQEMIKWVHGY